MDFPMQIMAPPTRFQVEEMGFLLHWTGERFSISAMDRSLAAGGGAKGAIFLDSWKWWSHGGCSWIFMGFCGFSYLSDVFRRVCNSSDWWKLQTPNKEATKRGSEIINSSGLTM